MKYLLISILCLGITIPILNIDKKEKDSEAIYEEYHEVMLNNFDLTYDGKASNEDLQRTLQEVFPTIFDEVVTVHLYKTLTTLNLSTSTRWTVLKEARLLLPL